MKMATYVSAVIVGLFLGIFGQILYSVNVCASRAMPYCQSYYYSFDRCLTYDGQLFGNPQCVKGIKGEAFWFGGRDYIRIPQKIGNDFTITVWVKTSTPSLTGRQCFEGNGIVWSDVPFVHNDYILSVLNDKACFFTGNPDKSILSRSIVTDGRWHFIAVTRRQRDGHVMLYVDGVLQAEMYSSTRPLRDQNYIAVGGNVADGRYFVGTMDDLRFYQCALSSKEIKRIYASFKTPSAYNEGAVKSVFGTSARNPFIFQGNIYYLRPGTSRLPDFSRLRPAGHIYSAVLNVLPQDFKNGFPGVTNRFEWFAIDYKGKIYIPKSATYTFSLLSDDGSKLIIDNKTVIDNDGVHPPREKIASIYLKKGLHNVEVQYFQGPRYQVALVLSLVENGRKIPFDIRRFAPVQLKEERCQSRLTLGSAILFDFNKYDLKPQAISVLDSVISLLSDQDYKKIIVEGHTDSIGSNAYNDRLSRLRAQSVANYLVSRGIPQRRIRVVGYGKRRPLYPNDTDEHRAKNRRVEIVVKKRCGR